MPPEPSLEQNFEFGPYLLAAVICERVMEEKDGVKSAIRMIDQLNRTAVGPNPPPEMEPFQKELGLLLRFKAGGARGTYQVEIRLRKPSRTESDAELGMIHTIHFPGPDDSGLDIIGNLMLQIDEVGTWWFDVYLNEKRVVRIPLRVVYLPQTIRRTGIPGTRS